MEENDQGRLTEGGKLSIVDLLIMAACFLKKASNIINIKTADLN